MKIGIVGSEEAKFTKQGRKFACNVIRRILSQPGVTDVISGGCHLGGIDQWAIEIGKDMGLKTKVFLPKSKSWSGGYKDRNIQIAEFSDEVHCITVNHLPENYTGMRFKLCYHCMTDRHVKSGGCWTMKYAEGLGKSVQLHVIRN